MITVATAAELRRRGLRWRPVNGDRFVVPDRDLDDQVFVVSDMSVEVAALGTGDEMRFNGTVEWALDSIAQSEVVWLPREDQLRAALGERFTRLERGPRGWTVVLDGGRSEVTDLDVERAYARSLLAVLPAASTADPDGGAAES